ncbi:flagellar biosynthesis protein FlhF [bacterium]|nr:flagellar biosynthesis protein FlhF [bacterium]
MSMVKAEFGEDAVILDSRRIQRRFFGLLGREAVEVTAALDVRKRGREEKTRVAVAPLVPRASIDVRQEAILPSGRAPEGGASATAVARALQISRAERADDLRLKSLEGQIAQISSLLETLVSQRAAREESDALFGGAVADLYHALLASDVDASLAQDLCAELVKHGWSELSALYAHLRELLIARPFTTGPLYAAQPPSESPSPAGPRIVVLVGPTGVGKTTTLAKISADLIVYNEQPVAYITQDTYRLAASEQLEKYANILGVPLTVVYEPDDFRAAVERQKHCRYIFVDTAGRSQHNEGQMVELERLLATAPEAEAHLVLSAGTKNRELYDTVEQFSRIPIRSLIFTKLDEALTCGSLYSTAWRSGLPVSYCTNGQNVPEDFFPADGERLADLLLENGRGVMLREAVGAASGDAAKGAAGLGGAGSGGAEPGGPGLQTCDALRQEGPSYPACSRPSQMEARQP